MCTQTCLHTRLQFFGVQMQEFNFRALLDFPGGISKDPTRPCRSDLRDAGSIPAWGRSSTGENGNLLQNSCLDNPVDREAWQTAVHRVTQSRTQLKRLSQRVVLLAASQMSLVLKNLDSQSRSLQVDPWVGRSLGEGNGNPLKYPYLGNSMDRGAWPAIDHGVAKSQIPLKGLSTQHAHLFSNIVF